jgi:hypothetical protein
MQDPADAWTRGARAQRRVGEGWTCPSCGEDRPHAKAAEVCFECERRAHGREPFEDHHVFGRRNSRTVLGVPVNDHRAELSVAQYSWPPDTLENVTGSPLLRAAAYLRGLADTIRYLLEQCEWIAEFLERLDDWLGKKLGPFWWRRSPVAQFSLPRRKQQKK